MSGKFRNIQVAVTELHHDLANVRHPEKHSQKDVIAWMFEEHQKEIVRLAEDIAEKGLSPIELPLVMKAEDGHGYTVLEGNRRLTALKLLINPHFAPNDKLVKKFSALKQSAAAPLPRKVTAVLVKSREDGDWIIDRRHNGLGGGLGVLQWNTQQRVRAQKARSGSAGRYERALNVIDYAVDNDLLDAMTPELKSSGFPITNLERLLADSSFIQHMGLSFDEDQALLFDVPPQVAARAMKRVLSEVLGDLSVTEIKNATLRKEFAKKIKKDLPKPEDLLAKPRKAAKVKPGSVPETPAKRKVKSKRDRRQRPYLIESPISVSDKLTNDVYRELRDCDMNSHPLAAACLLRVFIDQSTSHYVKTQNIAIPTKGGRRPTLTEKIKATAQHLFENGHLPRDMLKKIMTAMSENGGIANPENLHLTLHSRYYISSKVELNDIWDGTYGPLLEATWSVLK